MPAAVAETLAVALLAGVLTFATLRPRGWPEAVGAVPAAALLVVAGALGPGAAWHEIRGLLTTVGFLAAILVLAHLCDVEGVFRYLGRLMATASRGRPHRLLALVVAAAAAVTAVLSLDATVVLLTPVVFSTAAAVRAKARPYVYACTHLANSGSLLLPVSNLTNLLAYSASGLSFLRFALLMALPWLVAVGVEYAVLRGFFAGDLRGPGAGTVPTPRAAAGAGAPGEVVPVFALAVLAATLGGFCAASAAGVEPVWVAAAGASVLAGRLLTARRMSPRQLVTEANLPFGAFVVGLGIVVQAVSVNGLGDLVRHIVPGSATLLGLLAAAGVAAVLANLVNNLPAVLVLLPAAAAGGPGLVLAILLGVNIGPNLTYTGSLATLLWRRLLRHRDAEPPLSECTCGSAR